MTSNQNSNEHPKTKHEEIMFYIESTNDIVSKILEKLEQKSNKDWNEGYDAGYKTGLRKK